MPILYFCMDALRKFQETIFTVSTDNFEAHALALFRWQATHNAVYRQYMSQLRVSPETVSGIDQIPFLPIDFFKQHTVLSVVNTPVEVVFESSGTTHQQRSHHHVTDLSYYHRVSQRIFETYFGPLSSYHVLALLPTYLERNNASLVAMADHFIQQSASPYSGFYLNDYGALLQTLSTVARDERPVLLIGVTFALLRLAEEYAPDLTDVTIIETGGMKGMRREMIREEVYSVLRQRTGVRSICSEYGMTELLSQAYSKVPTMFRAPAWMKILIREINDPFAITEEGAVGGINVIDLANVHSCAFIETMDRGKVHGEGLFEVLGRLDNSDIRGCNTMVTA